MTYSHVLIPLLWLIFTGLFFYMARLEHGRSKARLKSLDNFNVREKGGTRFDAGFSPGEAFYAMREELKTANQKSHNIAAKSYFFAGLTALFSFVLSVIGFL
jgi:hypothetical protein